MVKSTLEKVSKFFFKFTTAFLITIKKPNWRYFSVKGVWLVAYVDTPISFERDKVGTLSESSNFLDVP